MLTSVGIFLRKLRLDHNEILRDMARKLEVSVSFLSAVENGKKKMPQQWVDKIKEMYHLSKEQCIEFEDAFTETQEFVEINLKNLNSPHREFAISLARKLETIDAGEIRRWIDALNKEDNV